MATNKKHLFFVLVAVLFLVLSSIACTPGDGSAGDGIMEGLEDVGDGLDAIDPCGNRGEPSSNPNCPNYQE